MVELSATIAASAEVVWRAFTTTALTEVWLGGFKIVSSWGVGDALTIEGDIGERHYAEPGTVLVAEAPTLLRFEHWSRLWRVPDLPENRAVMTVRIEADGEAMRVSLTHVLPVVEAIVPHSRFFWGVSLPRLKKLCEGQ